MDSPASAPFVLIAIVLGAIALVMVVPVVLERRHARFVARSPRVVPVPASRSSAAATTAVAVLSASAPGLESTPETVSADDVRRIVDPTLPPVAQSSPWRPCGRSVPGSDVLGSDGLGSDGSKAWTRAESDGLVALFHLGTDLGALAAEMRLDERVLVEELARRRPARVEPVG